MIFHSSTDRFFELNENRSCYVKKTGIHTKSKGQFKFLIVLLVIISLFIGQLPVIEARADSRIGVPVISVRLKKGNSGISVIIGKAKEAEGFFIIVDYIADNSLYKDGDEYYNLDGDSYSGNRAYTLEKKGTKKRNITLSPKELNDKYCKTVRPGKYVVKVRAYNKSRFGTTVCGSCSKEKTIVVKSGETGKGYSDKYDFSDTEQGDIIKFGAYEQDADFANGQEPIQWVVLSKTNTQMLLVSKYVIDVLPYNVKYESVAWEDSTIRKWLNSGFFKAAFNENEKKLMEKSTDKVFLPTLGDVTNPTYGFKEDASVTQLKSYSYGYEDLNKCKNGMVDRGGWSTYYAGSALAKKLSLNTDYNGAAFSAGEKIKYMGEEYNLRVAGTLGYLLRNTDLNEKKAVYVSHEGKAGIKTDIDRSIGVRPAVIIRLK